MVVVTASITEYQAGLMWDRVSRRKSRSEIAFEQKLARRRPRRQHTRTRHRQPEDSYLEGPKGGFGNPDLREIVLKKNEKGPDFYDAQTGHPVDTRYIEGKRGTLSWDDLRDNDDLDPLRIPDTVKKYAPGEAVYFLVIGNGQYVDRVHYYARPKKTGR